MANGRCPACDAILGETAGALTKVTVFQDGPSSGICMKCGAHTAETVRIRRKARNSNYQPNSSSSLDSHPLALLINWVAGKYHQTVTVVVPLCASCKKGGSGEPKYVDFDAGSMTFIGHRAWKEAVESETPTQSGSQPS